MPDRAGRQWRSFDAVLAHTPDFAYTFDLEGRFTYINAALLNLWQRSFDEAVGKNFFELDYPPELAGRLQRQIQEVIVSGQPVRDRTPYTGADGQPGYYEYIFVPVTGADGTVEAVAGSTRDITESARTEATLRESQRRFEQLADAMPQIVWTATADGALDYVNEQLTRYSGLDRSEALGAGWLTIVHPDDREKAAETWRHSLATGELYDTMFRLRTMDGAWRDHLVRARPVVNEAGMIDHWYGTCTDIQNERDIAQELAASRDRSRAILESISDAFLTYDGEWRFTYLNGAAERILQRSRENLLGRVVWSEFPEAAGSVFEREYRRAVETGVAVQFEEFYPPLNTWLAVHAYPSGQGLTVYFQDIGERKRAEAERERLLSELARSNAELAVFAHVAAHDLQSPLRMVKVYTQLLEARVKDQLDDSAMALMGTVLDGANRMSQLIQSLLNYAQVNQMERERGPVAMGSIVAEALAHLSPLIAEARAEIHTGDLPAVPGDGVQILQLMQNLLSNAVKYRRPDLPLVIRISGKYTGNEWIFEVRDNGQGIPAEYREAIFQPLKRLHGHEVPGTGIGLAVCQRIVERHGGRIWVEPAPDEGSSFYFTLAG